MYSRQTSVKIYEYVETEEFCNNITVSDLMVENVRGKEKKKNKARVVILILVCMLIILVFCCGWLIYSSSLYSVLDGYEDLCFFRFLLPSTAVSTGSTVESGG